jgi:hypothetical protein
MSPVLITLQSPALNYLKINKSNVPAAYRFFMIKFSSNRWFANQLWSRPTLGFLPGVFLVLAMFAAGCGKSKPAPVQASAPPVIENNNSAAPSASVALAPVPAKVEIPSGPDGTPDLKAINHAYIGWIVQNRRRPKDLDEFLTLSGVHFPPPPAGKKYIIDKNGFINFANQ